VLHDIGADTIRQVLVFNKIDAVPELAARGGTVERDEYGNISRVFLSARSGVGLDALRAAIAEIATADSVTDVVADRVASEVAGAITGASQPLAADWNAAPYEPRREAGHDH
jgi:GTPase